MLPTLKLKVERWKFNKEYRIYVSTLGNFKDENKENLPIRIGSNGYVRIQTPHGSKFAHRLVLLTWRPIPNAEDMTVDHKNHNKRDNSVDNLEWMTREENLRRSIEDYEKLKPSEVAPSTKIYCEFEHITQVIQWVTSHYNGQVNKEHVRKAVQKAIVAPEGVCKAFGLKWKKGFIYESQQNNGSVAGA